MNRIDITINSLNNYLSKSWSKLKKRISRLKKKNLTDENKNEKTGF